MRDLHLGDRSDYVVLMKRLLNKAARYGLTDAHITEDHVFDRTTEEALIRFQKDNRLRPADGACDTGTWRALGIRIDTMHDLQLIPQAQGMSGWSAAAAIILGTMVSGAIVPYADGSGVQGDLQEQARSFGAQLGWSMPMIPPDPGELIRLVAMKPIWVSAMNTMFDSSAAPDRAVVLAGAFGDGTSSATLIRVLDPCPPGVGRTYMPPADDLYVFREDTMARQKLSLDCLLVPP